MSTIIPYFDPILGKLRNSDVALISVASLIVPDPLVVNNLIVNSNASINTLKTNAITNTSTISTNGLGLNFAQWNSNTSLGPLEGLMNWSSLYGTIQLGLAGGNVDVPLGLTTNLPKRVRNSTGSTMPKGTAVYLNGVSGNTPTIDRALATGDRTSAFTIGMTAEDIANNATGWVTSFGLIRGVDTSGFTSGDTLYLSGATAGYYTNVPTKAPIHYVRVGTVTKASADGEIIVNVINGYELDELHNVIIASLASGEILQSGASSYWYNKSFASAFAETVPTLSLGSLAVQNSLSYYSLDSRLSLGSLAVLNDLSYTSLLNLPSLGSLAVQNNLSYFSLDSRLSLGSLAVQNNLSYYSLDSILSLGSLAVQNNLSYYSLDSRLSLGSLAFQNGPLPLNSPASASRFITAYNSTTGAFTVARPTWSNIDKTVSPINDLSDVTISVATNFQSLNYENGFWINETPATQYNLFENANQINNSTNAYGSLSDGWSETNTTAIQGGFPTISWDTIFDNGTRTGVWYLQEASGNALDENGVYTLTDTNTVGSNTQFALMAICRNFNGTNERFSGTVAAGNVVGSQTFIAYVRPTNVNVLQHICGYNDGTRAAYLAISATGKAQLVVTGLTTTTISSDVSLVQNTWNLIVGSYDTGGVLRIFVNGIYKEVATSGTHVVTTNSVFQIGATNSANHFGGYMNAVVHINDKGWDREKMLTLFAITNYQGVRIYRGDTISEISNYTLLGREQMHRFAGQTVTLSAEVWQEATSNGKVTLYGQGIGNNDSSVVSGTGAWETVWVTVNLPTTLPELYINMRSSSGTVGSIWFRNIRLNYGTVPMNSNVHHPRDWQKFPRLLMLDLPNIVEGTAYQYEEDRWYSWSTITAPAGGTGANMEWKFKGNTCYIKGQITQTHASSTWTHTLPIRTATNEVVYTKHIKIQNNAGTVALGNWVQTTGNSTLANMYATIANGTWSTTSGAKVAQLDMVEYEID